MAPASMLNSSQQMPQADSSTYDKFNSLNQPEQSDASEQEPTGNSEATKLGDRFSLVYRQFQNLVDSTPAGDEAAKAAKDAINAMANWLNFAVQKVNEQKSGTSTY